jgi:CRP-like cAMP-binding protein
LRILAIGAQTRYVHGGEVLFNAGEDAEGAYVIQEGRFSVSSETDADGQAIMVGPYTLLGEIALLAETTRPATATALEPATVLLIPRPLFLTMLDSFPESARRLRETLASRLNQSTGEIYSLRDVLASDERK